MVGADGFLVVDVETCPGDGAVLEGGYERQTRRLWGPGGVD